MPTQGSNCEPPANDIIEPLTFTSSKLALRGKAIVFQSRFPWLASSRLWVKLNAPLKKRNQGASADALLAEMKAIGQVLVVFRNLQVLKRTVNVFLFKNRQDVQEYVVSPTAISYTSLGSSVTGILIN